MNIYLVEVKRKNDETTTGETSVIVSAKDGRAAKEAAKNLAAFFDPKSRFTTGKVNCILNNR